MLIASEAAAARLCLRPRAAVVRFAVAGDDPIMMLTAIIPATKRIPERAGLTIHAIDVFEVNEAFASVVLAWIAATLLGTLEERRGRYGLHVMCESGGTANATLFERL